MKIRKFRKTAQDTLPPAIMPMSINTSEVNSAVSIEKTIFPPPTLLETAIPDATAESISVSIENSGIFAVASSSEIAIAPNTAANKSIHEAQISAPIARRLSVPRSPFL